MSSSGMVRVSKLMSLILRHEPERFGIVLDPEGYTPLEDLVRALKTSIPDVEIEDVRRVVETNEPEKSRFSIFGPDIRANYGHSLSERIIQQKVTPPYVLLHGTTWAAAPQIRRDGVRPMRRQYVHLTTSRELAAKVGGRHGKALVLEVDALQASASGVVFYRANEHFWLADFVPPEFIL